MNDEWNLVQGVSPRLYYREKIFFHWWWTERRKDSEVTCGNAGFTVIWVSLLQENRRTSFLKNSCWMVLKPVFVPGWFVDGSDVGVRGYLSSDWMFSSVFSLKCFVFLWIPKKLIFHLIFNVFNQTNHHTCINTVFPLVCAAPSGCCFLLFLKSTSSPAVWTKTTKMP